MGAVLGSGVTSSGIGCGTAGTGFGTAGSGNGPGSGRIESGRLPGIAELLEPGVLPGERTRDGRRARPC